MVSVVTGDQRPDLSFFSMRKPVTSEPPSDVGGLQLSWTEVADRRLTSGGVGDFGASVM